MLLKQTWRGIVRNPLFSLTVVASIGLGIAANTVIFSVADSLFFRPLSAYEPQRLVSLYSSYGKDLRWGSTSFADFRDLRDGAPAFRDLSAEGIMALSLGVGAYNERITGSMVTPSYFRLLHAAAQLGRVFDDRKGEEPTVIVLSHRFWQRALGADPSRVGSALLVNGTPFTVLGVMPEDFHGTVVGYQPEFWIPFQANGILLPGSTSLERRDLRTLFILGRLAPGATLAAAAAQVQHVAKQLAATYPRTNAGIDFTVIPAAEGALHPLYRPTFKILVAMLFAVVGIVLATVCGNVGGLMLARAQARRQETALRLALGASRAAVVRQFVAESLVLSLAGAALALAIGALVNHLLDSFSPIAELPIGLAVAVDPRVVLFTVLLALAAAALFGLAPALQSTRPDVVESIKQGQQASGFRRSRLRALFVFGQTAFAAVLVTATLLVLRGLHAAGGIDLGFKPDRVATAAIDLALRNYDEQKSLRFYHALVERLGRLPEVTSLTLAWSMPLDLFGPQVGVLPADASPSDTTKRRLLGVNHVYPGYFQTLGIPLLRGRAFSLDDDGHRPAVAIVNQRLAGVYWPQGEPLGKTLRVDGKPVEIVGVVADTKNSGLAEAPAPFLYLPLLQQWRPNVYVLARTNGSPDAVFPAFRQTLRDIDPSLAMYKVQTLQQHLEILLLTPRIGAALLAGFGIFALALASLGLYGTLAYSISQRSREIGVRLALGATRAAILRLIVGEGMRLTAAAVLCGLVIAAGASRFMATLLFNLPPLDPVAFGGACAILLAVAASACFLSARSALAVDPSAALKDSF